MSETTILNQLADGAIVFDPERRFAWLNSQAAIMLGQSQAALIGTPSFEVCADVFGLEFCRACQQVNLQDTLLQLQVWSQRLERWFDVQLVAMSDGLLVTFHDISRYKQRETDFQQAFSALETQFVQNAERLKQTKLSLMRESLERQRAQAALSATNAKLVTILETITDGVCAIDANWRFSYVNRRAEQLLQRDQDELLGKPLWEVYAQTSGTEFYQKCHECVNTQTPIQFEGFVERLNCWFQYNLYPSTEGFSLYFQDITIRKQAEFECQRLLEQEQSARHQAEAAEQRCSFLSELSRVLATSLDYQTTFNTIAHSIVPFLADYCLLQKLDPRGVFHPVVAIHRDPQKQTLVETLAQRYPDVAQRSTSLTAQAMRSQQPILISELSDATLQSITQDEQLLAIGRALQPVSTMLLPLWARGRIVGILLFVSSDSGRQYTQDDLKFANDIADRVAMAIDNTELYQRSQETSRLKDEFLNNLSHELRTPLHAINGWAQMLNRYTPGESRYRIGVETITRKAQELQTLIYDLLDLSRMIRGKLHLKPTSIDLIQITRNVISSFQIALEKKQLHLELIVNGNKINNDTVRDFEILTQHWEAFQVWADADRMRQIMWHILSNAIKFTPNQGTVRVKLLSEPEASIVEIVVEDSGKGIHPNFLPYVFECFRQGDGSTTRAHGGLGLGLSLVQYLVELHGGTINVSSPGEGQGTIVTLQLPKNKPEE
jgi:PAS domain S-box-containing protein